ncbi:hypothetical protein B0H16DRAFT_1463047 [Mycena metata]|uniref:Uncharacterized protein n=1 Tax=Mycena metata TaxID=1033252 RepID=A0AAD7N495_9AGAR|nr:hypothetical protein B0H16DRAFT_1463047 [Mycena metata]
MIRPLFKDFQELLQVYGVDRGKQSAAIYSKDRERASFTVRLFGVRKSHSIPNPETLIVQTVGWLKILDDPNLEGLCAGGAKTSGYLHGEAQGLYTEAMCCQGLRKYQECLFQIKRASALLELCGLSQGDLGYSLMNCQAVTHELKSEQLLQIYQGGQLRYKGLSLMNIAGVEVLMGAPYHVIQEKIDATQIIFRKTGDERLLAACDVIQADLNLREGDMSCFLFCKCLGFGWVQFNEVALQFIGDVQIMENDEVTAVSLFTIALQAFTYMDVHHSRAECMARLGDIAKKNGDSLKALELWETSRPLFERSLQAKRVQEFEERVGGISEEVKEQHRENLAQSAERGGWRK